MKKFILFLLLLIIPLCVLPQTFSRSIAFKAAAHHVPAAAFSPINQVGFSPVSWYVAANWTTNSGMGTLPDSWTNAYDLTNTAGSLTPTYRATGSPNGLPTLWWDGSDDFLRSSIYTNYDPNEYWLVIRTTNSGTSEIYIDGMNSATRQFWYDPSPWQMNSLPLGPSIYEKWMVICAQWNGVNSTMYTNNVIGLVGNTASGFQDGITFGTRYLLEATRYANMEIAEIISYGKGLPLPGTNDAARLELYNYLAIKYDITKPSISVQPVSATISEASTTNFTVNAAGSGTLVYQWKTNSVNVANSTGRWGGATTNQLWITNATAADSNTLVSCVITNAYDSITSSTATLTVVSGQIISDSFDRADSADLGTNWDPVQSTMKILSNVAEPGSSTDACERYSGVTWTTNQSSEAEITSVGAAADSGPGVGVRCSGPAITYYRLTINGDGEWQLGRKVSGTYTAISSGTTTYVASAVLKLSIVGTTLTSTYNNSQINSVTDTNISTGSPGIVYSSTATTRTINNWVGKDGL